jgi:hypothetical protein
MKRTYRSPQSLPTEVAFEQALLVSTARFLLNVDETVNMNIMEDGATLAPDGEGGDLYFEF